MDIWFHFIVIFRLQGETNMLQALSVFFTIYVRTSAAHRKLFLDAFMPTLRTIAYAPESSPLSKVSGAQVALWMLDLLQTDPGMVDTYFS